jgi:hypothetical protein
MRPEREEGCSRSGNGNQGLRRRNRVPGNWARKYIRKIACDILECRKGKGTLDVTHEATHYVVKANELVYSPQWMAQKGEVQGWRGTREKAGNARGAFAVSRWTISVAELLRRAPYAGEGH